MKKQYHAGLSEAVALAKEIGPKLSGGEVLALIGPLGSGKTAFSKALAKTLHIQEQVTSPTFVIMNQYPGRVKIGGKRKNIYFYHLDLYRTESAREVADLGLKDIWQKPDTITVIEWADKIQHMLPKNTITIIFKHE